MMWIWTAAVAAACLFGTFGGKMEAVSAAALAADLAAFFTAALSVRLLYG